MQLRLAAGALALALAATGAARAATLYERFGGKPGMDKLAAAFVQHVTQDPRVSSTFEDSNLDRVRQKFSEQLCQVTDGGCAYTGHSMVEAHRGLHANTAQFNAVVEDLQAAMDELDIPFSVQNQLLARLAPMYRDVVTR